MMKFIKYIAAWLTIVGIMFCFAALFHGHFRAWDWEDGAKKAFIALSLFAAVAVLIALAIDRLDFD